MFATMRRKAVLKLFGMGMILMLILPACGKKKPPADGPIIAPIITTEPVKWDTDDPAIWINPNDPARSLIIGTDKDVDGALYVFDLDGKIIPEKTVRNLKRPNNVDVEYGLKLNGKPVDIAVATERMANKIRVYKLPEMTTIDNGGIDVFTGETLREPMGISLYKRPKDGAVFAIVSRKSGPKEGYLWQYLLKDDGKGNVIGVKVRAFGAFSGKKEIESIAVDDQLGFVYYSDEQCGIRKYYADPETKDADQQLGFFNTADYFVDSEGISVYTIEDGTGYVIVSNQSANKFHIYTREGEPGNPHNQKLVKIVDVSTNNSDGSDVTNVPVNPKFPAGLFVAMSDNKTFQFYSWTDIAGKDLKIAPNGKISR